MKRRDLLVGFPVVALGMSGPAQGREESKIIRLGAEFDTAYAWSREAALAARPLYQEWDRKGKGHTVERQFQMQEYFAYQPYAEEWSRRSEVVHEIADRLTQLKPQNMRELLIVARAEAFTWGSESLGEYRSLFDETPEAQILSWMEERIND